MQLSQDSDPILATTRSIITIPARDLLPQGGSDWSFIHIRISNCSWPIVPGQLPLANCPWIEYKRPYEKNHSARFR